ncbi:MAG: feruloyl-CoA synthase [Burkholderiaceae bacterium]
MAAAKYRDARVGGCLNVELERRAGGEVRLRSIEPLGDYPARFTDSLERWAAEAPQRVLVARRGADGRWIEVTYAQMLANVKAVGAALVARGLSAERPVAVLSGNGLEHLVVGLACAWAGIAYSPVSPAYSLISQDYGKLRHIMAKLTPGLVFADDAKAFGPAIAAVVPADTEVVTVHGALAERSFTRYQDLLATAPDAALEAAHAAVGPDTIVKFLFTSGSTRLPKAVTTTNRMICANQQMLRQSLTFLQTELPVLVDWLPWNHVFGGTHNVGIALTNGGTLYIDDGKPVPGAIETTLANLREISPTIYFNVPKGFEEIARAMRAEPALARKLLARVRCFFFAGAGLSQPVWDELEAIAEETVGERIPMFTGLGMTETAPSSTFALKPGIRSGSIGLPCPGVQVRLVPVDGKTEIRFGGPNVMPGYWREPELSAAAFDDEGFYCTGDAVKWADPADPQQGLVFDGRIAEDFKLASGTFVNVGPLRTRVILDGDPVVQDVVITAPNRDDVGLLVFARFEELGKLAGGSTDKQAILAHPAVTDWFRQLLARQWAAGTGSATRVARLMIMQEPPSIDRGEITDKGSFNQRAVLSHRAEAVDRLHAATADQLPLILLARADG